MRRAILAILMVASLMLPMASVFAAPVITDTNLSFYYPTQGKSFYGYGRYWVFFVNSTSYYYTSTTDGLTWIEPVEVVTDGAAVSRHLAVAFDGTYVHYARQAANMTSLMYRRGLPDVTGAITWTSVELNIFEDGNGANYPTISIDLAGYPWIAWNHGITDCYVEKSSTKDGTWTTAAGFPATTEAAGLAWRSLLQPETNGMAWFGVDPKFGFNPIVMTEVFDNGSVWAPEATTVAVGGESMASYLLGTDVYLFWNSWNGGIYYGVYDLTTHAFSGETALNATTTYSDSGLGVSEDGTNLYVVWEDQTSLATYRIYMTLASVTWNTTMEQLDTGSVQALNFGVLPTQRAFFYLVEDAPGVYIIKLGFFAAPSTPGGGGGGGGIIINNTPPAPVCPPVCESNVTTTDYILGTGGAGIFGIVQNVTANVNAAVRQLPVLGKLGFYLLIFVCGVALFFGVIRRKEGKKSTIYWGMRGVGKAYWVARTMLFTLFLSFFLLYIAPQLPKGNFFLYWGYIVLFTLMSYVAAWVLLRWGQTRK